MTRFKSSIFVVLVVLAGCAFDDGDPWGHANISLAVDYDAADRDVDGRLKTSKDYLVELTDFRVGVASMTMTMIAEGGAVTFDPANPPEGYSLCHAGHCHADDGSLVPYEDIQAELNSGGTNGAALTQNFFTKVDVSQGSTAVPNADCLNDCNLDRGQLNTVDLIIGDVLLEGRVYDSRAESRLPAEGVPFSGRVLLNQTYSALVHDVEIGEDQPVELDFDTRFQMTEKLFDPLEFDTLGDEIDVATPEVEALIREAIAADAAFEISITRRDRP